MKDNDIQIEDIWKSEEGYMVCGFMEHWDGRPVTVEEKAGTLEEARRIVEKKVKMVKGPVTRWPKFWWKWFGMKVVILKLYRFSHVYEEVDEVIFMKREIK